jgi:hypothetical protein
MFRKIKNMLFPPKVKVDKIYINVVEEFSASPGGRYEFEGAFSGEIFRKKYLWPKLNEAIWGDKILVVTLDGAFGYGCAFLEEAFGGLVRDNKELPIEIKKHLEFVSDEEPGLVQEIMHYIDEATTNV